MKRKFIKTIAKITGALFVCTMFASFSPSLDGRAVVADEGVFPEGLFAKTVGYLPGDELSVTNISGNSTIQILVIGALDPSEGVAILLSPEAAQAIGIEKNSNNIVKITKRTGQDERCVGAAVIAKTNDADAIDNFENAADEEKPEEETEGENSEDLEIDDEEFEEEFTDDENFEEESVADEEFEEESADDENFEEEFVDDEEFEEESADDENFEEEFADDEEFEEESADDENFEEEFVDDEKFAEPLDEEDYYAEDEFFVDDEERDGEFEDEPISSEYVEEYELGALEEAEEEEIDFESFAEEETEDFSDEFAEEHEEKIDAEPLENETDFDELDEDETEEYDAIVLVPADDNPPVVEDETVVENYNCEEPNEADAAAEVEDADESYNEAIVVPTTEEKPARNFDKYIVRSFDDLEKGAYYIQIAVMNDEANITDVVSKYGKNYPIAIIPKADGNGNYILIGPLNVDEYGAVLARFKAYGYKDAFLRKIK